MTPHENMIVTCHELERRKKAKEEGAKQALDFIVCQSHKRKKRKNIVRSGSRYE